MSALGAVLANRVTALSEEEFGPAPGGEVGVAPDLALLPEPVGGPAWSAGPPADRV